jgi:hypothetical protein
VLEPLPGHRTLSVLPTYRCTAACTHCGTFSHPRRREFLDPELMLSAIDQAVESGYKVVVFTGGEPTLAGDNLLRGIARAASAGLVTRMVTNAWWATSDEAADTWVRRWVAAGLREINFSTGDQHARFVPLLHVMRGCRAACRAGLETACVMVETVRERSITAATVVEHPVYQELVRTYPRVRLHVLESPWMPIGAGARLAYTEGLTANRHNVATRGGCNSCLSTTTIEADGGIAACCGLGMSAIPELQLGRLPETTLRDADERAGNDFLKRWIRAEGPERILAWAATHDEGIDWENMYAHRCQACLRLYRDERVRAVIRERHQEKLADVIFAEWLMFHFEGVAGENETTGEGVGAAAPREPGRLPGAAEVTRGAMPATQT